MNPDLLAKYDGVRVPRYTSYPTAPHFSSAVGPEAYGGWLAETRPDASVSLYVHIPFCRAMCWYCGCHTKIVARYQPIARYAALLVREIEMVADLLPAGMNVRHVHWGGGTPTILEPEDFGRIMGVITSRFRLAESAEVAVEIDPRSMTREMAQTLAASGVTRASLGVQDFDRSVQERVNRVQPYEVTLQAAEWVKEAGIEALNLDLMYGLPGQTPETCRSSAEKSLTLRPNRLAVFGYAHVPWMKRHQRLIDESGLPDGEARWQQFAAISDGLEEAGFTAIGLDHFARAEDPLAIAQNQGRLRRNFQGYTDDPADVLIGFGASAIGALPQGFIQNATPIHEYESAIGAGRLATIKGLAFSAEDRLRADAIERLMCNLVVDAEAVATDHGAEPGFFDQDLTRIKEMEADGLAAVNGRRVTVPEEARPLVRVVAAAFDAYLGRGVGRHAKAI